MNKENNLFTCKNKNMAIFLKRKGCKLFEEKSTKDIYIFEKSNELSNYIKEYKKLFAMCKF